ncbi:MAG: 3-oxoacyl-ACP reductase family protein [Actinomycetota bacterium]
MRFEGKVVLVTGASQGIGEATAVAFGTEGAAVVVNHFGTKPRATAVGKKISGRGGAALVLEADVSDPQAVGAMIKETMSTFGRVDILVNNAGIVSRAPISELAYDEWERVIKVNLGGVFNLCKEVVPIMLSQRYGKIINISSELAIVGEERLVHYCAAKAGILGLSKALAREVGPSGIQVNVVAPGKTRTPMLLATPSNWAPEALEAIPLRRLAEPEEIAATVCFLASPDGDYYAGAVLSPNGGIVMW